MRDKVIYYRGDKEGINSRGRDICDKGRDNRKDGRSKA